MCSTTAADNPCGLIQPAGEYLDHGRYRNRDSYVGRTLIRRERFKGRAVKLAEAAANGSLEPAQAVGRRPFAEGPRPAYRGSQKVTK